MFKRAGALVVAAIALAAPAAAAGQEQLTGTVQRAIDGDTIVVRTAAGDEQTVRLIGVDTPETKKPGTPVECGGVAASAFMAEYEGDSVTLTTDSSQDRNDRFGRLLAYADVRGADIGLAVIAAGHSDVYIYDGKPFVRQPKYEAARDNARGGDLGAWSPDTCKGDFHSTAQASDTDDSRVDSAEQFMRSFYFRLNGRRYATAWGMLSAGLRSQFGSYSGWRAGYRRTVGIRVNAAQATLIGGGRAVVVTRFRARDRDACTGGVRQQFFRARWVLSRRNGKWVATSVTARKTGGQPVRLLKSQCPKPKPSPARPSTPDRPPSPSGGGGSGCNPSYSPCVPNGRDYDCSELDGPYTVRGDDPYRLDGDNDGVGCE